MIKEYFCEDSFPDEGYSLRGELSKKDYSIHYKSYENQTINIITTFITYLSICTRSA